VSEKDVYHPENTPNHSKPEIVKPWQWFQMFSPQMTTREPYNGEQSCYKDTFNYKSPFILNSGGLMPDINFTAHARPTGWYNEWSVFAPFLSGRGYQTTDEDYKPDARAAKIGRLASATQMREETLYKLQPLALSIYADDRDNAGDVAVYNQFQDEQGDYSFQIKPEFQNIISSLRLQVAFPSGIQLEAKSAYNSELYYDKGFYPMDGDTFAEMVNYLKGAFEGCIVLPDTLDDLQKIRARLLLPQQFKHALHINKDN